MSIFGSSLLRTIMLTIGLSLVVLINPVLFFVATFGHLIIMHHYGHKATLMQMVLFMVVSAMIYYFSPFNGAWLTLWLSMSLPYLIFTLGFMVPVKRRLHTILFLGLFHGIALIVLFNLALSDAQIVEQTLNMWNELMSYTPSHQYVDVEEARINWLYELSVRSVAYMVQFSAFIWFAARWVAKPQARAAYLRKFRLSEALRIFLAVSGLSYVGLEMIIRWTSFDVLSQFHFVWTNIGFMALFLLSLEGLGVTLTWAHAKQWRAINQERVALALLLLMMMSGSWIAVGLKVSFGLLGLGFSRRKAVV